MYSPFRHAGSVFWKRRPVHLTLFLTGRCNSRCAFCFYLSERDGAEEEHPELSVEEIRRISLSMDDLLWLAFSGGEIFLRKDLVDIARLFYDNNKPVIMLFPTNGLLPDVVYQKTGEVLEYCRKSTVVVKLSLDGLEKQHDRIRGVKGGFRKTLETYSLLEKLIKRYPNFELGVNTVFCSENQNEIESVIEFVKGMKNIKTHTISLIRGSPAGKDLEAVDMEKYHRAINALAVNLRTKTSGIYRFKGSKLKAAQDILQRRLIYETMQRKKQLIPCYAGRLNVVITENGDVYPCESFNMKMGNLRNTGYDMDGVVNTKQAGRILRFIDAGECYCTHECYFLTNILFNPRTYPELFKEYVRLQMMI